MSLLLVAAAVPGNAQLWNQNLVVNGDAESGTAVTDREQTSVKVPGWTISGNLTVGKYDSGDGFYGLNDPGPVDRGSNFLLGGKGSGKGTAAQTIDLSSGAAEIDAGRVRFNLAAFLTRIPSQSGAVTSWKATFKDATGKTLLSATVNGPTPDESYWLLLRASSGFVLPNTRSVEVVLDLTNVATEDWNECAADNLSLVLSLEAVMGTNLVVNGDGETAPGKDGRVGEGLPVPGWNAVDSPPNLFAESYSDARIEAGAAGPEKRQNVLVSNATGTLKVRQAVDVTLAQDLVDGGGVTFKLSAYLGGIDDDAGQPSVTADFLDASGKTLSSKTVGPVTQSDRGGKTGLLLRASEGSVPVGTRMVRVTLEFANGAAVGNAQYADDISLVLASGAAAIKLSGIANAASGASGAVAPGEMVALATTGIGLASAVRMQLATDGTVSRELGGVKVYFDGTQAPLLYVSSSQIGAIVPFDCDGKTSSKVHVEYQGVKSSDVTQTVAKSAPGIFTQDGAAKGLGLIYNGGTVLNSKTNPAASGSTVTIYWTGGGQTNPAGTDGRIETGALPVPVQTVSVKIGGKAAELVFAGAVPYAWAGLLQVQVKVPAGLSATEAVPVAITAGSVSSPDNAVTMWVK